MAATHTTHANAHPATGTVAGTNRGNTHMYNATQTAAMVAMGAKPYTRNHYQLNTPCHHYTLNMHAKRNGTFTLVVGYPGGAAKPVVFASFAAMLAHVQTGLAKHAK